MAEENRYDESTGKFTAKVFSPGRESYKGYVTGWIYAVI
jgi:hypothetical protein